MNKCVLLISLLVLTTLYVIESYGDDFRGDYIGPRRYAGRGPQRRHPARRKPPKTEPFIHHCPIGSPLILQCQETCPKFFYCDRKRGIDDYGWCCPRYDICPDNSTALPGLNCKKTLEPCPEKYECHHRINQGFCCPTEKVGFCPNTNIEINSVSNLQNFIIQVSGGVFCSNDCVNDYDCDGAQKCCVQSDGCKKCVDPLLFDVRSVIYNNIISLPDDSFISPTANSINPRVTTRRRLGRPRFLPRSESDVLDFLRRKGNQVESFLARGKPKLRKSMHKKKLESKITKVGTKKA